MYFFEAKPTAMLTSNRVKSGLMIRRNSMTRSQAIAVSPSKKSQPSVYEISYGP